MIDACWRGRTNYPYCVIVQFWKSHEKMTRSVTSEHVFHGECGMGTAQGLRAFPESHALGDTQSPGYSRKSLIWPRNWWTDAEAGAPILWPPDVDSWLTGKDPNAGKDWGQEEKGATEDEIQNTVSWSVLGELLAQFTFRTRTWEWSPESSFSFLF